MKRRKKIMSSFISLLLHIIVIYLFVFFSPPQKKRTSPVYEVSLVRIKRVAPQKQRKKAGGASAANTAQNKVQTQEVTHDENWFPVAAAQEKFVAPTLNKQKPSKQSKFKMSGERLTAPQGNIAKILQKVRARKTGNGSGRGNGDGIGNGNAFFDVSVEADNVVYVIDISTSMNVYLAAQQLKQSYHKLTDQHTFNIIAFAGEVYSWKDKLQKATQENKQDADKWLQNLGGEMMTNLYKALKVTYEMIDEDTTIYLVTDGYTVKLRSLLNHIGSWQKIGVYTSLNIIAVGQRINELYLQTLAKQNNGTYVRKQTSVWGERRSRTQFGKRSRSRK
ncbi:VWA domain-containing protein [Candidatus Uabimicrobium amorphum]|uniref:VWFA domain-containing protein n=1 Tax=Uabimicrobium amorphum TaxID=2596890 RepID=A0A5S9IPZ2_UABAM|nr:VWA domain-containing protein [Candidatus Uabimicrobium amorphum]BBM85919.1 hypothetical protein UABAM_04305 [Candidatus Uabimicrobium amorphum]